MNTSFNPRDELPADIAVRLWRQSLSEAEVRDIATDYIRGARDQCSVDGFAEYELRFGSHSKGPNKKPKKSSRKRPKRK